MSDIIEVYEATNAAPQPWLRIAVPSFDFGWVRRKKSLKKQPAVRPDEYKNLLGDILQQPVDVFSLTESERHDYEHIIDIRRALYDRNNGSLKYSSYI